MKLTLPPPPLRAFLPAVFRLFLLALLAGGIAHAQVTGVISGSVVSTATRNGLQGATVSVPAQGRAEFTDSAGLFLLQGVSPGAVEVVVSYSAFEVRRVTVTVRGGETARVEVEMKPAQAIVMDRFTVATVREGQALAITEQRNALNVKSVTALDEWGVLPTQNVGELVSRLPGITFTTDEDNLINNVSIGGLPASYTRLNIDGLSSTGVGGDGRTATLHSFSGSMYEQVEIIAGQTPDKRADSLGGQLNLKTRSPSRWPSAAASPTPPAVAISRPGRSATSPSPSAPCAPTSAPPTPRSSASAKASATSGSP